MSTKIKFIGVGMAAVIAGQAGAGIVQGDPSIVSPFDHAQVDVVWVGSNAGYTGELQWLGTSFEQPAQTLWTNKSAVPEQSFRLPQLFSAGERVDFQYEIVRGKLDAFATTRSADWGQFRVDASDPFDVMVGIEDIRLPGGDSDHNDAIFRVMFSQASVPSPGSVALLGMGGLVVARRRR